MLPSEECETWGRKGVSRLSKWFSGGRLPRSGNLYGLGDWATDDVRLRCTPALRIVDVLKACGFVADASFNFIRYQDAPAFTSFLVKQNFRASITDGTQTYKAFATGMDKDSATAVFRAVGEFLERQFLTMYKEKTLTVGSVELLQNQGCEFLEPSHLAGFSRKQREQNGLFNYSRETVFAWEYSKNLSKKKKVLVPAQLIYWNYKLRNNEALLRELNTSGAGGMIDYNSAVLSGFYELVQRDALMIFWLNMLPPPKIDPRLVKDLKFQSLLEEATIYGFDVHVLDLTTDLGVPTFGVVIENKESHYPKRTIGLGAGRDALRAVTQAFVEAWSVYYWLRKTPPSDVLVQGFDLPRSHNVDQFGRASLFGMPEHTSRYDFFLKGVYRDVSYVDRHLVYREKISPASELESVVSNMEKNGPNYDLYVFKARHRILKKVGFHSVRVIVPALIPLHLNEVNVHLGGDRLRSVPLKLGYKKTEHWNTIPHPFA